MGCGKSKTSDEQEEDYTKGENDSKKPMSFAAEQEEREARMEQQREEMDAASWVTRKEGCATDDAFVSVVEEALRVNFTLITCNEFKDFLSSRYTCEADESFQNEIIHKVIGEQFVKGCLAIKLV